MKKISILLSIFLVLIFLVLFIFIFTIPQKSVKHYPEARKVTATDKIYISGSVHQTI